MANSGFDHDNVTTLFTESATELGGVAVEVVRAISLPPSYKGKGSAFSHAVMVTIVAINRNIFLNILFILYCFQLFELIKEVLFNSIYTFSIVKVISSKSTLNL